MATTRKPKGSYSRPTTDFFIANCMIGGVVFIATTNNSAVIELYNNAQDGSALHLYKLWVQNDASGVYWVTRQTGTQGGTQVQAYPVISSGAALPGIINYATAAAVDWLAPPPFVQPAYIAGDNEAGSQDEYSAPGPICVLIPGDSLRVFSPSIGSASSGFAAVTFYWAAFRDLG
jgi:hypothetical protein